MSDTEKNDMLICPYNKAHVVSNLRMPKHLRNCRNSYKRNDIKVCQFNSTHHIAESEYASHLEHCPSKVQTMLLVETSKRKFKNDEETIKNEREKRSKIDNASGNFQSDDEWDNNPQNFQDKSGIDKFNSNIHIVHFQHMTKSKREAATKAHYEKVLNKNCDSELS
ncbi:CLUMA_CG020827, isoform A [Clunio marinus]|uniref:CLUMA_CG020827, isoform A n=1 Tax=Clunio marinus TaxID=568069 RepID=A0A1J1J789_9DIPT|nr:CLUMA_CG020827, isoform A [Clunio marinus]